MYKFICPCCGKQYMFDIVGGSVVFEPPSLSTGDNNKDECLTIDKYEFGVPVLREEVSDVSG